MAAVAAVAHVVVVDVAVVVGLGRTAAAAPKHKAGLRPKLGSRRIELNFLRVWAERDREMNFERSERRRNVYLLVVLFFVPSSSRSRSVRSRHE